MSGLSYTEVNKLEELSLFLDDAGVCMHCVDAAGIILWANKIEINLLGYTEDEIIGHPIADFYADHEVIADLLQRLSANEDIHHFPVELVCKDGSSKHLLINSSIYRRDGEFIHTRFFGQDVTRLRIEEAAHRDAEKKLKNLEGKYKQEAIEMAFSAMDDTSRLGDVLHFMKASFTCHNYNELAEEIVSALNSMDLKVTVRIMGHSDRYVLYGNCDGNNITDNKSSDESGLESVENKNALRFIERHKSGGIFYDDGVKTLVSFSQISVLIHNMPVEDELLYGKIKYSLTLLVEGANAAVIRITSGLLMKQASEAKSLFLANMSHELRTPLNSIIGFTQRVIVKEKDSIDKKSQKALEAVHRNGQYLLELINSILDVSKVAAGKMELEYSTVEVGRIMEEVHEQMFPLAENKHIELNIKNKIHTITAEVDPVKVFQIVTNLVSNAIKFTDQGSVTMTLDEFDDAEIGNSICIKVSDSGKGIKESDQEVIFQKFSQVDSDLTTIGHGTGLGLAIVKDFTQLHHGRIEFFSQYGAGCSFSIILPQSQSFNARVSH